MIDPDDFDNNPYGIARPRSPWRSAQFGRKYDNGNPPRRIRPILGVGRFAKTYYDENGRKIRRAG
jgi:hypothetical protein